MTNLNINTVGKYTNKKTNTIDSSLLVLKKNLRYKVITSV